MPENKCMAMRRANLLPLQFSSPLHQRCSFLCRCPCPCPCPCMHICRCLSRRQHPMLNLCVAYAHGNSHAYPATMSVPVPCGAAADWYTRLAASVDVAEGEAPVNFPENPCQRMEKSACGVALQATSVKIRMRTTAKPQVNHPQTPQGKGCYDHSGIGLCEAKRCHTRKEKALSASQQATRYVGDPDLLAGRG